MTTNENDHDHTTDTQHPVCFDSVQKHLQTIFDADDWVEFRALQASTGTGHILYRQVPISEDDTALVDWLHAHNLPEWALYIGGNPRKSNKGSGVGNSGTEDDVDTFKSLFVDFDDATPNEALVRIESASLPHPTLLITSGRATGTHAYWKLNTPITDPSLWSCLQRGLIKILSSDKRIIDPPRIMRLAGSDNHKRNAPCRVLKILDSFEKWEDLNLEPAEAMPEYNAQYDPLLEPDYVNLNSVTLAFLHEPTPPEDGRNNRLVAAAFDYCGNNFPLAQAIHELAIERAIKRDGLPEREAIRCVERAYTKICTPSYSKEIVEDVSAADLLSVINSDRGMPSADFEPESMSDVVAVRIVEKGDEPSEDESTDVQESDVVPAPIPSTPSTTEITRADNRPIDPRDRALVSNVKTKVVLQNGRKKICTLYKPVDEIARDMTEALGGYPRRSAATGLFAIKETKKDKVELWNITDPSDLFALLHDRAIVRWVGGECETLHGDTLSAITKTEFFRWVKDNIEPSYAGVSEYPHVPPRPSTYYLPTVLPEPTGECLKIFIDALNPASDVDRKLMLACAMTPAWGGPTGARPMFVFSSDYGQGSGKTETAKAIGRIWGGAASLDYEDNWQNICKRIMSSDDWLARCFLFDNIKGKFGGAAIEAAVTADFITGHKMFVGTVKRPNDATFMLTFNLPELSPDLSKRAVVIKVGKPNTGNFVEWASEYVEEHRMQLISDLLYLLRQPAIKAVSSKHKDRWGPWQRDVLARVPDCDVDELAAEIIERRPATDADAEEASTIVQALNDYLMDGGRRNADEEVTELTGSEIVKVMEVSGNWRANDSFSDSSNSRKCMSVVKRKLLGRGVLMPVVETAKDGQNKPKKVRVDDNGKPSSGRGRSQSIVYGWVWAKAQQVLGTFSSEDPELDLGSSTDPEI